MSLSRRGFFATLIAAPVAAPLASPSTAPPIHDYVLRPRDTTRMELWTWNPDLGRWDYDGKEIRIADGDVLDWAHYDKHGRLWKRDRFTMPRAVWPAVVRCEGGKT